MLVRLCLARVAACMALAHAVPAQATGETHLEMSGKQHAWPRLGLNLAHRSAWGAEQLMANVLRNPGFEPGTDGALLVVGEALRGVVADNSPYLNRDEGFWVGARFQVLTGPEAGASGWVKDSHPGPGNPAGPTRFQLEPFPSKIQVHDVVAVQGQQAPGLLPLWWTQGLIQPLPGQQRPGSPGSQSVRLASTSLASAALLHHLDGITARAGKLLVVEGPWVFSIWARSSAAAALLQVRFRRHGAPAWIDQTWAVSGQWQEFRLKFDGRDTGPAGPIELSITARQGAVDVDDVYLGEAHPGAGGFRKATVAALQALRPGYLREWQGQLGDTVPNRLATSQARMPSRYRAGAHDWMFHYSVAEFAELAAAVGARPWYVLPTASSPEQARSFGAALRELAKKHAFEEVVVEYGNEHWNSVFRAAGIADPARLSEASASLFQALRDGAGPQTPLHLVVGAQFVKPESAGALLSKASPTQGITVGPYFAYRMNRGQSANEVTVAALNESDDHFKSWRQKLPGTTDLSVYEVNAHTTLGDAPNDLRAQWAGSSGVGVALARRLLQASAHGVSRQAVYKLSGFDAPVDGVANGLVPLFGVTHALGARVRLRPAGEALAALNELDWQRHAAAACSGSHCAKLIARFFASGNQLAVVSSHETATPLTWACSKDPNATWRVRWMSSGEAGGGWREDRVVCKRGLARWSVPPLSFAVMQGA